jgi:hypothetical protein
MMLLLGITMGAWMALSVLAATCYGMASRNRRRAWEAERRVLGIGRSNDERTRSFGLPYGRRSSLGARTRPSTRVEPFRHSALTNRMPVHIGRRRSHEGVDDREPVRRLPSTGF